MHPTVLIVDDEPLVLSVVKDILAKGPYDVFAARSASEALDLMTHQRIDVVISDERMPGMPGSEFLAIVKERYPETVRMILTGHASVEAAIKAINEGEIYRFLTKPCNSEQLHTAVKEALDHHSKGSFGERSYSLMASLEKQAPGITRVKRDEDGAIIIDYEND
jgi:DNA-binding NtrC family response regulator